MEINEWVQVLGLSAILNGVIISSIDYVYKKKGARNELQLQAMKDRANACSEFCFYLRRMILNEDFQLHAEDDELIKEILKTYPNIDEEKAVLIATLIYNRVLQPNHRHVIQVARLSQGDDDKIYKLIEGMVN